METENNGIVSFSGHVRAILETIEGVSKNGKKWVRRVYLMDGHSGGHRQSFMFSALDDAGIELRPKMEGTIWCKVFAMRNTQNGRLFLTASAIRWEAKGEVEEKEK